MHVLLWIAIGIAVGWASGLVTRGLSLGRLADASIGLLGAVVSGSLFWLLGLIGPQHGYTHVVVAAAGAAASVAGIQLLVRATARAVVSAPAVSRAVHDLEERLAGLGDVERRILAQVMSRDRTTRDVAAEFEEQLTLGQRLADRIAALGGSWTFISAFVAGLIAWIVYNVERSTSFDPYPFILLNLLLSCLAALQAPVIMMSQNRMAAKDRIDARHDYEVNLKAEMEIMQLHAKLDELQQNAWRRLIELQERQLDALHNLERLSGNRSA